MLHSTRNSTQLESLNDKIWFSWLNNTFSLYLNLNKISHDIACNTTDISMHLIFSFLSSKNQPSKRVQLIDNASLYNRTREKENENNNPLIRILLFFLPPPPLASICRGILIASAITSLLLLRAWQTGLI